MKISRCVINPSRRDVLKASLLAAGAAAVGPRAFLHAAAASGGDRLKLAVVGCGGRGTLVMRNIINGGAIVTALCDPDESMTASAKEAASKHAGGAIDKDAKIYSDYRKLLENGKSFDAVLVATPDHWHAPLCKAFMAAGKHVYCEKPLTHTISEARELRELSRASKVVTQMGNQGSASVSLRRSAEVIMAGALGQIREIYIWGAGSIPTEGNAKGEDTVPAGFDWDCWVGPSAMRPYVKNTYHPYKWRGWADFGSGGIGDFACHGINLPMRALNLGYPEKIVVNVKDGKTPPGMPMIDFCFAAREKLPAVTIHWMGSPTPSNEVLKDAIAVYKQPPRTGCLIVGEKGSILTNIWNQGGLLKLEGEAKLVDITRHEATKNIAESLPRTPGHETEFVNACKGQCKVFSSFDVGGKLTEIGLAGVLGLRLGKSFEWDGEKMEVKGDPSAAKFIKIEYRRKWLL